MLIAVNLCFMSKWTYTCLLGRFLTSCSDVITPVTHWRPVCGDSEAEAADESMTSLTQVNQDVSSLSLKRCWTALTSTFIYLFPCQRTEAVMLPQMERHFVLVARVHSSDWRPLLSFSDGGFSPQNSSIERASIPAALAETHSVGRTADVHLSPSLHLRRPTSCCAREREELPTRKLLTAESIVLMSLRW